MNRSTPTDSSAGQEKPSRPPESRSSDGGGRWPPSRLPVSVRKQNFLEEKGRPLAAASRRLSRGRRAQGRSDAKRPHDGAAPPTDRERVRALLETGSGVVFEPADLERWRQPCVYLALDAQEQPVYVGVSRNGLQRVLHRHHRAAEMRGCRIVLWSVPTLAAAQELEGLLIAALQPAANVRGRWARTLAARLGVGAATVRRYGVLGAARA